MKYIVWKNEYESYRIKQGDGYFVKYKDKLSDVFSINWYDASKYQSIGPAIGRLGIYGLECTTIDAFRSSNKFDLSSKRDTMLSNILNESISDESIILSIIQSKGRIDRVSDTNEFLGDASNEIIEFIKNKIASNNRKVNGKFKKIDIDLNRQPSYIDTTIPDDEFWAEVLKN